MFALFFVACGILQSALNAGETPTAHTQNEIWLPVIIQSG